jgi:ribosomal protein S18 acetylase RimI-like enzyme
MDPRAITLQDGDDRDPALAAALIFDTDPHIFSFLHGHDRARADHHLAYQWQQQAGLFSHRYARLAVDGAALRGLALGFSAAEQQVGAGPFFAQAQAILDEGGRLALARWVQEGRYVLPPIPPMAFYLQNLAVVPELRGRGVGQRLLEDVFERARQAGCEAVHLDLYAGNPAQALYERAGFKVLVETRVPALVEEGIGLHLHMAAAL